MKNNSEFTMGEITGFSYFKRGRYLLQYEFYVNEKKYIGETSIHYFDCINDKKCIGDKFKIVFSNKNPSNNEIELGELEKYRARSRFFKIDWNAPDWRELPAHDPLKKE